MPKIIDLNPFYLIPGIVGSAESMPPVCLRDGAGGTEPALFYAIINWVGETQIVTGVADFRLMPRQVVDAWMGFKYAIIHYRRDIG